MNSASVLTPCLTMPFLRFQLKTQNSNSFMKLVHSSSKQMEVRVTKGFGRGKKSNEITTAEVGLEHW